MAIYIYRSAKTGKIVSEKYAKANPDLVVKEKVKEAKKTEMVKIANVVTGEPMFVKRDVDEPPPTTWFRAGDKFIEVTANGNVLHWKENGVHCTEATEMTGGEPVEYKDIFAELNG